MAFPDDLPALARLFADWIAGVPGVPAVFLFGSRVRGDHRPDSDVDLAVFLDEWGSDNATNQWWTEQNATEFAELKATLPGPLAIHKDAWDDALPRVLEARKAPVLNIGKAVCVLTPPKSAL